MQLDRLKRRNFIALLGGAAAWPLTLRAQQPAMPVIGFLNSESLDLYEQFVRAFHRGLNEAGFVEGRNVVVEYRWAEGNYERLPALADELARRHVAVIVANPPSVLPAKAASATIPIIFTTSLDPVAAGIVRSLSRPGGNLTGLTSLNVEMEPKRLELLHELVPTASVIAALVNPAGPNAEIQSRGLEAAARTLGVQLHLLHASTEAEFDQAFASVAQRGAGALLICADPLFVSRSAELAALAARHAVPSIWQGSEFVAAGGLASYGTSIAYLYHQLGIYAGRILKGEKPAELPVQQVAKIELVINLKTARALGITVPLPLLGRADDVIE
jgi:putative tryptophan/tyrosine transport system substrate-binding protein